MTEWKQEKSCGAVIFRMNHDETEVLLIHQNQGHWCFPKGHVKKGETERQTAYREVREETGLKIRFANGFRDTTHYVPYIHTEKEAVYFLGIVSGGREKVQKEEVMEMKWIPASEACDLLTFANDRRLLEHAIGFLRENNGRQLLKESDT